MILVVVAAVWNQISYNFLFFLAGLQSIPKSLIEAAAIDGAGPGRRFWTIVFPLLSPDDVLPARHQHRLRVLQHVRDHRRRHRRRAGTGNRDPRLQGLQGRLQGARSGQLRSAVGDPDGDRDRAHDRAVPVDRAQGAVLMAELPAPAANVPRPSSAPRFPWRRRVPREGMVENRPFLDFLTHAVLILGVAVIAFPVYVTFVASTITAEEVLAAPMPLVPGPHLIENYREALLHGAGNSAAPVWQDDGQQPRHRARRSPSARSRSRSLSAFAIVYFKFPFRMFFFWMIFVTLMLPGGGPHPAHVQDRLGPRHAGQLRGAHAAADRFRHRDVPVPAVLPDDPRRARRGCTHRRRRSDALLLGRRRADEQDQHGRAVRHPVHLRLEPVPVAADRDHAARTTTRWSSASSA